MALISFLSSSFSSSTNPTNPHKKTAKNNNKNKKIKKPPPNPKPSSWEQFKNLLSCKNTMSSICPIGDIVHGGGSSSSSSTRVISSSSDTGSHTDVTTPPPTSRGGMQLMKLSGCYECRAVDAQSASRRYPRMRTVCTCTECGEVFAKSESLEMHQAIRHAVSELGVEDSGRNIVEIIFKSSWQKKNPPTIPTVHRILKIHNTQSTITKFEDYRNSIKSLYLHSNPTMKNPRCAADGNELLRFHSTSISCALGSDNSTSLCLSSTSASATNPCTVCTIIRCGFAKSPVGVRTTASSGRAHDDAGGCTRAMLVCRVIAGRVKRRISSGSSEEGGGMLYDSVEGEGVGLYGNLEELFVANPRAILPCFVVIYKAE